MTVMERQNARESEVLPLAFSCNRVVLHNSRQGVRLGSKSRSLASKDRQDQAPLRGWRTRLRGSRPVLPSGDSSNCPGGAVLECPDDAKRVLIV